MSAVFLCLRQQIGTETGTIECKLPWKSRNLSVDLIYWPSTVIFVLHDAGAKHLGNHNYRGWRTATEILSCSCDCIRHGVETRLQANLIQNLMDKIWKILKCVTLMGSKLYPAGTSSIEALTRNACRLETPALSRLVSKSTASSSWKSTGC